ncbi:MAG: T9SS type A sorting domain-containing protein [Saprospiraceae bacterium]|nr:T9SS type A sorting domain-containing protein [Saprospiraceae bacterium]
MKNNLLLTALLFVGTILGAQPTVDGNLSDLDYSNVASKLNANMGFGPDIDVTQIVYYSDPATRIIYVGMLGKLNNSSTDGMGLMLNLTGGASPTGAAACSALGWALDLFGNIPGHYMSGNFGANPFYADFEVDLMFAVNPGASATDCYVDFTSVIGGFPVSGYLGNCGQDGTSVTYLEPNTGLSVTFAFQNGGGNLGFEMAMDYSATSYLPDDMEAFAFITSATAYFSDVTVPGNVTAGNLAFSPDFCAQPPTSGPYHSTTVPVPVELMYFEGELQRDEVLLSWATANEYSNDYFEVEQSLDLVEWTSVDKIHASGNSFETQYYELVDKNPKSGMNYYRLKQVDFDGTKAYSETISINYNPVENGEGVVFPNPVQDVVYIQVESPAILQIFDTAGRRVYYNQIAAGTHELGLDNWYPGLYWVQAKTASGTQILQEILIVE